MSEGYEVTSELPGRPAALLISNLRDSPLQVLHSGDMQRIGRQLEITRIDRNHGTVNRHFAFQDATIADHERDWPPCKVVCLGLATNTLNVKNSNGSSIGQYVNISYCTCTVVQSY